MDGRQRQELEAPSIILAPGGPSGRRRRAVSARPSVAGGSQHRTSTRAAGALLRLSLSARRCASIRPRRLLLSRAHAKRKGERPLQRSAAEHAHAPHCGRRRRCGACVGAGVADRARCVGAARSAARCFRALQQHEGRGGIVGPRPHARITCAMRHAFRQNALLARAGRAGHCAGAAWRRTRSPQLRHAAASRMRAQQSADGRERTRSARAQSSRSQPLSGGRDGGSAAAAAVALGCSRCLWRALCVRRAALPPRPPRPPSAQPAGPSRPPAARSRP